ncbi:MAG: peptidyl-prolyl cis-trans isomerase C, partial [Gammaproteobacteria bacterium]
SSSKINISAEMIQTLREQWLKQNGSEADKDTMDELVESLVREEVMVKEAKRLGLDKNDIIIHRRLLQKMDFLSANLSQMQMPDEHVLNNYFEINKEKYRIAARRSFTHVYFSKERRSEKVFIDAQNALEKLSQEKTVSRAPEMGDNFILQYDYRERSQQQLAQVFGTDFAQALFNLNAAQWQGPILSEYGAHLVYIDQTAASYIPELDDIKARVMDDLIKEQLIEIKNKNYEDIRSRYQVTVEY